MWGWFSKPKQAQFISVEELKTLAHSLVVINGSIQQLWCGERSLLDALDRADVPVRSSCRSGNCGACLAFLDSGSVAYTKEVGFPLEPGEILMCSCVPVTPLVIRLPDRPVGSRRKKQ